jgi:hypothetical protein
MRLTTRITTSATGEVLEHEFYEYDGQVALACGATAGQQDIATSQTNSYTTLMNQASAEFGQASGVFNDLVSSFAPIVSAGPNQQGFSPAEVSAMNSQAITNNGQAYKNEKAAVGNAESTFGGGNSSDTSGGATVGENLSLAENAGNQTASDLNNITQQNYATGRQNYLAAAQNLSGATNVFSTANSAGSVATGSGEAAATSQNNIAAAANAPIDAAIGAVGAVAGAAVGAKCPAEGSLYLLPDGREVAVETLQVGELLEGIDGEPQLIEEIQRGVTPILRIETEDGFVARNSRVHAYALPAGGFVVALHALGKVILTAKGRSRVISVTHDGEGIVYNVITNGSHTYRADGIWALGVGEAERVVGMDAWNRAGDQLAVAAKKVSK